MTTANARTNPRPRGRIHVLQILGNAIAGGMEAYVARLIERLPKERFTTTVVCPFESAYTARLRALDVEVLVTPMPHDAAQWCSIQLICTLVHNAAIDVLHAHLPNAHLLAGVAGSLLGKPVITTIHGRQMTPLDLEVHRAVQTRINVVCKQTYFHALGMGVSAAQLSFIRNGVDTTIFFPQPRAVAANDSLRCQLGIPGDAPVVGFVGRLHWEKGPEVFAHAALLVSKRHPDVHFVMVGEGPMQEELEQFIASAGLTGRLHLAGLRTDMPAIYREFDLFVCSSYSEATPLAVMEAMACGLPVIGTNVGGVPDLIEQDRTGRLVPAGDPMALAHNILDLISLEAIGSQMGRMARERAVAQLALSESVERVAHELAQLVPGHGEPRHLGAIQRETPRAPSL